MSKICKIILEKEAEFILITEELPMLRVMIRKKKSNAMEFRGNERAEGV